MRTLLSVDTLAAKAKSCRECLLWRRGKSIPGCGPAPAEVLVVGQAGGIEESQYGIPFIGQAGQFLTVWLQRYGLKSVYYTNLVKHFPGRGQGGDLVPNANAISTCTKLFLEDEIKLVRPKIILAVGAVSMRWFGIKGGIRNNSGRLFRTTYGPVIPIIHPASLMRKLTDVPIFATQLGALKRALKGSLVPPASSLEPDLVDILGVDTETDERGVWCIGFADAEHRRGTRNVGGSLVGLTSVFHNAKFDIPHLERAGVTLGAWEDSILEAHLLGYRPLALEALSSILLGVELDKTPVKERHKVPYDAHPDTVLQMCSMDAWASFAIHQQLAPKVAKWNPIYEMEKKITRVLIDMEARGIPISQERLKTARRELTRRMGRLELELRALGITEPGNTEAIGQKFWRGKGQVITTKTGIPSTRAEHLRLYATTPEQVWVDKVIEWRSLDKFNSTYFANWVGKERIHANFNQTGTNTWRFSCSNPNLQNVPKNKGVPLYQLFVAPEGYTFISADWRQLELVVLANLSEDPAMIQAYLSGSDLHRATVERQRLIARFDGDVDKARRYAKTINFGIVYMITPYGLAPRLSTRDERVSEDDAQEYIDGFYRAYPAVLPWQRRQIKHAEDTGYVETFLGRPLWIPGIHAERGKIRLHAEKQAINGPVQGGGMEVIKQGMLAVPEYLVCNVHDELLYLVPDAEVEDFKVHLQDKLVDRSHHVPYTIEVSSGKAWGDIKHIPDTMFAGDEEEE